MMISEQVTLETTLTTGPFDELRTQHAQQEDLAVILEVLMERGDPLTLENASFVLAVGLRNKPAAWTITPAELVEMWAELVGEAEAE